MRHQVLAHTLAEKPRQRIQGADLALVVPMEKRAHPREVVILDEGAEAADQDTIDLRFTARREVALLHATGNEVGCGRVVVDGQCAHADITFPREQRSDAAVGEELLGQPGGGTHIDRGKAGAKKGRDFLPERHAVGSRQAATSLGQPTLQLLQVDEGMATFLDGLETPFLIESDHFEEAQSGRQAAKRSGEIVGSNMDTHPSGFVQLAPQHALQPVLQSGKCGTVGVQIQRVPIRRDQHHPPASFLQDVERVGHGGMAQILRSGSR